MGSASSERTTFRVFVLNLYEIKASLIAFGITENIDVEESALERHLERFYLEICKFIIN